MFEVPGYLKIEAWPSPDIAQVRVTYDPTQADESRIQQAIMEPYYELAGERWRMSPFGVQGYDPLAEILTP